MYTWGGGVFFQQIGNKIFNHVLVSTSHGQQHMESHAVTEQSFRSSEGKIERGLHGQHAQTTKKQ
jgi:hypothetical protein